MENLKFALKKEVELLGKKHRQMLSKQREKKDFTYGLAWLAIWEGQIDSYERILESLEKVDGESADTST